jgi:hypothetical protein
LGWNLLAVLLMGPIAFAVFREEVKVFETIAFAVFREEVKVFETIAFAVSRGKVKVFETIAFAVSRGKVKVFETTAFAVFREEVKVFETIAFAVSRGKVKVFETIAFAVSRGKVKVFDTLAAFFRKEGVGTGCAFCCSPAAVRCAAGLTWISAGGSPTTCAAKLPSLGGGGRRPRDLDFGLKPRPARRFIVTSAGDASAPS